MPAVVFKIDGLDRLARKVGALEFANKRGGALEQSLALGAVAVAEEARRRAPKGQTGLLRASITPNWGSGPHGAGKPWASVTVMDEGGRSSVSDARGKPWAVEKGRGPGPIPPPNTPRGRQLRLWAQWKGMNPYAVWRSLQKKSIPAQPFLIPAFEENRQAIVGFIQRAYLNILLYGHFMGRGKGK